MCGITGLSCTKAINEQELWQMCNSLYHRGPDAGNIWLSKDHKTGLGHRRLAIIDLSENANQPMVCPENKNCIVFNGEIYNFSELKSQLKHLGHRFRSSSDTEVILHSYAQWGTDCINRLKGAFAFCIFDPHKQTLFLARDRAGEKPLFYLNNSNSFAFASEMKAILSNKNLPRDIDPVAMDTFLAYGYVTGDRTILKNIKKLPPAHAIEYSISNRTCNIWKYWNPFKASDNCLRKTDLNELTEELNLLLQKSIRQQMIADVPLGILLSGGIDSSLITAIASQSSARPVKTFTIAFPGHQDYNEAKYAKIVASHFATDHTELEAEPASLQLLPLLAAQFDEPIADPSIIPTFLVSKMVREHCTVALGGDGADELFGGYPTYNWIKKQKLLRNFSPNFIRKLVSSFAGSFLPIGCRGRTNLMGLENGLENSVSHFNVYFDHVTRSLLLPQLKQLYSKMDILAPEKQKALMLDSQQGLSEGAMRIDFATYLPDNILVKVDRASMLNSLEVRAPFLDFEIIEFAYNKVPEHFKVDGFQRKILLKELARKLLPEALDLNRKQGFVLPLKSWFKEKESQIFKETLLASDCMFERSIIKKMLLGQNLGLKNAERLFSLTLFELWRKHYKIPAL